MKNKAVFLDRDGVLNIERSYVLSREDLQLYPFAGEAVKIIKKAGYLVIVVTNQSAVARKYITHKQLQQIHDRLFTLLENEGAYLTDIYYCPHIEPSGNEDLNNEHVRDCECRKPKPGMILQAAEDYTIDLKQSYFIGDSERDIIAGKRAGCTTIGVRTGHALNESQEEPDYIFDDLKKAAEYIVGKGG